MNHDPQRPIILTREAIHHNFKPHQVFVEPEVFPTETVDFELEDTFEIALWFQGYSFGVGIREIGGLEIISKYNEDQFALPDEIMDCFAIPASLVSENAKTSVCQTIVTKHMNPRITANVEDNNSTRIVFTLELRHPITNEKLRFTSVPVECYIFIRGEEDATVS